mgnify:CR=1 FL=1
MKSILKIVGMAGVVLVLLSGCRTGTVYNSQNNAIEVNKKVSDEQVYKAIKIAGINLGWKIKKVKPGLALAQLNIRNHMAKVEIPYTGKDYSIIYKDSINLKYDKEDGTIHNNYNGWIQNLEKAINMQIKLQSM